MAASDAGAVRPGCLTAGGPRFFLRGKANGRRHRTYPSGPTRASWKPRFALRKAEANALLARWLARAQMQSDGAAADSDLGRHLSQVASGLAEAKSRVAEASVAIREHSSA